MTARSLPTRGPCLPEPPEAQAKTVPVGKRTAFEVREKVVPRRTGIRAPRRSCSSTAHRPEGGGHMPEGEGPVRYYLGVDWVDQTHAVWVVDERGTKITARTVPHTAEGLSEWGRELDEWRAHGLELWAAIERPEGRVVDFLLDHGVLVYPVNPKALDRARDRFRQSAAKSDPFDARVLADFLRTDHPRLRPLQPSSDAAQELKLLTEDCQRQIRQQTRLINQLTATLKARIAEACLGVHHSSSRCSLPEGRLLRDDDQPVPGALRHVRIVARRVLTVVPVGWRGQRVHRRRPPFPCFREAPPSAMLSPPEDGRERRRRWRRRRTSRRW